jgi:hypothetical protein
VTDDPLLTADKKTDIADLSTPAEVFSHVKSVTPNVPTDKSLLAPNTDFLNPNPTDGATLESTFIVCNVIGAAPPAGLVYVTVDPVTEAIPENGNTAVGDIVDANDALVAFDDNNPYELDRAYEEVTLPLITLQLEAPS